MTHSENDGREPANTALDDAAKKQLNTLDNLIKLRAKISEDTPKENKNDDYDPDEEGGLPGYSGIF